MARRMGAGTIRLERASAIAAVAAVGSRLEQEGPLGAEFDRTVEDSSFGEKSWEKAETKMQQLAMELALQKGQTAPEQVDVVLGGDLLNQCIASAYAVRELGRPFLGLYGACSTMAESLTLAALLVEGGAAEKALAVTSSHFCSSERQFRFPLNYGGVRTPTAQHTATASGAALVGKQGSIHIEEVCIGRVVDLGVTDLNNMGAAMAPAAWDTLRQYFADTGTGPADYDKIITGDLAQVGQRPAGAAGGGRGLRPAAALYRLRADAVRPGGPKGGCRGLRMRVQRRGDVRAFFAGDAARGVQKYSVYGHRGADVPHGVPAGGIHPGGGAPAAPDGGRRTVILKFRQRRTRTMQAILPYLYAFLVGGAFCLIGQVLIDRTKLTPARILSGYVVAGVLLGALGWYQPLIDFAGAGATVPLTGFGSLLARGVKEAVAEQGLLGALVGGLQKGRPALRRPSSSRCWRR